MEVVFVGMVDLSGVHDKEIKGAEFETPKGACFFEIVDGSLQWARGYEPGAVLRNGALRISIQDAAQKVWASL